MKVLHLIFAAATLTRVKSSNRKLIAKRDKDQQVGWNDFRGQLAGSLMSQRNEMQRVTCSCNIDSSNMSSNVSIIFVYANFTFDLFLSHLLLPNLQVR